MVQIPKNSIDIILGCSCPTDLLALYCFYRLEAHKQGTDSPRVPPPKICSYLGIDEDKTKKLRDKLKELGLIEDYLRTPIGMKRASYWHTKVF